MTKLTHRRTEDRLNDGFVILFAEEGNEHYGEHVWTLKTELPRARDCAELIEICMEYYAVDYEKAKEMVDPDDIVSSCDAWDNTRFCETVWDEMKCAGFRTNDGAVVLDSTAVELDYQKTEE